MTAPLNLAYLRDVEVARGTAAAGPDGVITKNPRQDAQHAHLHAFYVEDAPIENYDSSALPGSRCHRRGSAGLQRCARHRRHPGGPKRHDLRRQRPVCGGSRGVAVTAHTNWASTARSGSCLTWDHRRTTSTGAWPGPMASRPRPTRTWAGSSTWSGPPWPMPASPCRAAGHRSTACEFRDLRDSPRTEPAAAVCGSGPWTAARSIELRKLSSRPKSQPKSIRSCLAESESWLEPDSLPIPCVGPWGALLWA